MELLDELSIFLLRLFLYQKVVMLKHVTQMKTFFGDVTHKQATKVCNVCCFYSINYRLLMLMLF